MIAWLVVSASLQAGYATGFENAQGWTFASHPPGSGVAWAADGTPADVPGGAARSGNSLNYNNGVDYRTPGTDNGGIARSPVVDVSALADPRLSFWCNYATEPGSEIVDPMASPDARTVRLLPVLPDGTDDWSRQVVLFLGTNLDAPLSPCAAMGIWHRHEWRLADVGLRTRLRIELGFSTLTADKNGYPGWFVDDLSVADPAVAAAEDRGASGNACGALGIDALALLGVLGARRRFRRNSPAERASAS